MTQITEQLRRVYSEGFSGTYSASETGSEDAASSESYQEVTLHANATHL